MTAKRTHEESELEHNVLTGSWPRLFRLVDGIPNIVWRKKYNCKIHIRVAFELLNDCSSMIWLLMENYRLEL